MKKLFSDNKIDVTTEKLNKFENFCNLLLENNKKFNITAIREEKDVYLKHFCDSLMGREFFEENKKILEVGSGGGFPSIPLKIYNENFNFTLLEATNKKCQFLNMVKDLLSFDNFEVLNGRAEEIAREKDKRENFDIVTARAVASLNSLSELCLPFLKVNGKAIFYKNYSEEEIDEGKTAIKKLGCKIEKIEKYKLSEVEGDRCIIIIRKHFSTPEIYPREYKKILKTPL